ncbi:hypothetical protein [Nocardiopsis sp. NPDC057823]|uniref:hypothetical protein n=1 Tax=Nocardiopsis sp. NPDC057823 TaxID=3346256 RepID=UPI00366D64FF
MSQTSSPTPRPAAPGPTPLPRALGIATALTAVVALVVLAFSWPAVTAEPKDVPIALVGPDAAVEALGARLAEDSEGLFDTDILGDRDSAVEAVERREVAGAVVLGPEPELLTASATGPLNQPVAQLAVPLQAALTEQAPDQGGRPVALTVTDVVPYSEDDPNGGKLSSAFFPLLLGGMIGGIAIGLAVHGAGRRAVAVLAYSAVGGTLLTGILQTWFGSLQGDFWSNAAAFGLALGAIAAPIVGFVSLLGRAGIAVGPVVMMLFANPISGATLPAQFLPGAWGAVGQWFPPGASATLVRGLSYFPDADLAFPWLVLAAWAACGLLLTLVSGLRRTPAEDPGREAAAGERRPVGV